MVKDSKRFANTNKWGFFTYGHKVPPYSPSAKVMPSGAMRILPHCRRCQDGHGLGAVLSLAARETAVNIRRMLRARRLPGCRSPREKA